MSAAVRSSPSPAQIEQKLIAQINKNPRNAKALYALGNLYMQSNAVQIAAEVFQRLVRIAPSSPALTDLGVCYRMLGRPELAEPVFKKAIDLDAKNGVAHYNYGCVQHAFGRNEEAIRHLNIASELVEGLRITSRATIATIKEVQGRLDEAFSDVKTLLEEGYNSPPVIRAFCNILAEHAQFSAHIDRGIELILSAREQNRIKAYELNSFLFLLGRLYQRKNEYDKAFSAFSNAHALSQASYDEDAEMAQLERTISAWSEVNTAIPKSGTDERTMIFVVGVARSGSTLIDQILSVNPETTDLGECDYFAYALGDLLRGNHLRIGLPLSADEASALKSLYISRTFNNRRPTTIVTDKTLFNWRFIGNIIQTFPDARIVWCRRDPRDSAVSTYTNDFTGNHPYRHDLAALARFTNKVEEMMQYWFTRFPNSIHIAKYEDIVENPTTNIRKLIEFCGFEWTDDYLNFSKKKRAVSTASYNQVTKPIYTGSLGRWKNYEPYIAPLLDELIIPDDYQVTDHQTHQVSVLRADA